MNALYNPLSLIALTGFFVLCAAWLGGQIANSGAAARQRKQDEREDEGARLQVFAALRVLQQDASYVHAFGDFNGRLGVLWLAHQQQFISALRAPAALRALDLAKMQRLLDVSVRCETLLAWLTSKSELKETREHISAAAHETDFRIRECLDALHIDYERNKLVTGEAMPKPLSCVLCTGQPGSN